jgi:hypothetical protein
MMQAPGMRVRSLEGRTMQGPVILCKAYPHLVRTTSRAPGPLGPARGMKG